MKIIQLSIFIFIILNVKSDFTAQVLQQGITVKSPLKSVECTGQSVNPGDAPVIVKFEDKEWLCTKDDKDATFQYTCVGEEQPRLLGGEKEKCVITEPETGKFELLIEPARIMIL